MKTILVLRKVLATSVFVSGVVLYLLFATAHPLLHNHPEDGEHHHDCSACNFLATASFAIAPDVVIVSSILYQADHQIFFDFRQTYKQRFHESNLTRGPPLVSV
ncbi:MAG: hypothetical protein IBX72_04450 [Nitrospirae bacterium]|nr:hypothetical protein [Nitrospirota bacterium]